MKKAATQQQTSMQTPLASVTWRPATAIYRHALQLARALPPSVLVADQMVLSEAKSNFALPLLADRLQSWSLLGQMPSASSGSPTASSSSSAAQEHIPRSEIEDFIKFRARRPRMTLQQAVDDFVQLRKFMLLSKCTTVCVSKPADIRVELSTQQDEMQKNRWMYRVRMNLLASSPHQCLVCTHRTLTFEEPGGQVFVHMERAPKVVGHTPEIKAGLGGFQYYSSYEDSHNAKEITMSGIFHFSDPKDSNPETDIKATIEKTPLIRFRTL